MTEKDWQAVYEKAWKDAAFKRLLEEDPTAALKRFAQETGKTWTKMVRLPLPPPIESTESTADSDLDQSDCLHLVSCC